jgi:hypothetical protein
MGSYDYGITAKYRELVEVCQTGNFSLAKALIVNFAKTESRANVQHAVNIFNTYKARYEVIA